MRIVGGNLRGRKLKSFSVDTIRPTTDRVREAVFNVLAPYLPCKKVLDLFAGTGAMTIEALSRGATEAVLVESDAKAVKVIRENLSELGLLDKAVLINSTAEKFIDRADSDGGFDLVILDPPYGAGLINDTLSRLANNTRGLLAPGAVIVAECATRKREELNIEETRSLGLTLIKEKKYGDTYVYFFEMEKDNG